MAGWLTASPSASAVSLTGPDRDSRRSVEAAVRLTPSDGIKRRQTPKNESSVWEAETAVGVPVGRVVVVAVVESMPIYIVSLCSFPKAPDDSVGQAGRDPLLFVQTQS